MLRLFFEGMITVPTVGLCSGISFSSSFEMKVFQSGSIFIHLAFSSYLIRPCSERDLEISISCSTGMCNIFESSIRLCHAPFLILSKKSSTIPNT